MVRIAMLMPGQSETDKAIQRMAGLGIEHLDWQLYTSPEDLRPGGGVDTPSAPDSPHDHDHAGMVEAGKTIVDSLVDAGVPKASAAYFARRLESGSPVLIASVPARRAAQVREVIEEAGGRAAD